MKNDGGPAFPVLHTIDGNWVKNPLDEFKGMSLRDYFAAAALQGFVRSASVHGGGNMNVSAMGYPDEHARMCYRWADAMLAERKKGV